MFFFSTVPVSGRNYSLHSPKVWTPEEKELFDKANEPPEPELEVAKKELEPIRIQATKTKSRKIPVKKQKVHVNKDQIQVENGVSYREVAVRKGETIFGITLRYRNEGATYSEVLRFNGLKDPDRIADGYIVKIPVKTDKPSKKDYPSSLPRPATPAVPATPAEAAAPLKEAAKPAELPVVEPAPVAPKPPEPAQPALPASSEPPHEPQPAEIADVKQLPAEPTPSAAKTAAEQLRAYENISSSEGNNLFEQGVLAYRKNDCQTAIQLFGRFLADNRNSSLAGDVSVFIADCYLKLSGK